MNNSGIRANDLNPGGSSPPAQSTKLVKPNSLTASPSPESSGRPRKALESTKILESSVTNRHVITNTPATDVTQASLSPGEALRSPAPTASAPRSWANSTESPGKSGELDPKTPKNPPFEVFREFLGPSTDLRPSTTPKKRSDVQHRKFTSQNHALSQNLSQDPSPQRPKTYRPDADGPWSTAQMEEPMVGSLWATADPNEDGPRATQVPTRKTVPGPLTSWVKPRNAPPPAAPLPVVPVGPARRPFLHKGGRSRSADGIVRQDMSGVSDDLSQETLLAAAHALVLGKPHAARMKDRRPRAEQADRFTLTAARVEALPVDPADMEEERSDDEPYDKHTGFTDYSPSPSEKAAWEAERSDNEAAEYPRPPTPYDTDDETHLPAPDATPSRSHGKATGKRLQEKSPAETLTPHSEGGQGGWKTAGRRRKKAELAHTPLSIPTPTHKGPIPGKAPRRTAKRPEAPGPSTKPIRANSDLQMDVTSSISSKELEEDYLSQAGDNEDFWLTPEELQDELEAESSGPRPAMPYLNIPKRSKKLEPSMPTPPTPAGEKSPAKPPTLTPRERQAAKKARDEEEEYGQQGAAKRNHERRSRALPISTRADEDLAPTSWLARLREPRETRPAKAGESLGVVVDGFPPAWKPSAILIALALASRSVLELNGVAASRHLQLSKGGWLLIFPDVVQAEKFLQHGHKAEIKSVDGSVIPLSIHLPGSPSQRKEATDTLRARRVFTTIPIALAQELTEEAAKAKQSGADPAGIKLRQQDSLQLWLGKDEDSVRGSLISQKGGIMLTFARVEDATASIEVGVLWEGLNVRSRCRPFLPREEVTLQPCHRCCGYGHTESRCPGKPVCRSCGQKGHCEVNSKCPNNQGPLPGKHWCISCGLEGHKHGSHTCTVFQAARRATIPRAGQRIQERIRELKGATYSIEASITTPAAGNATFLETARRATTRSSTAAPVLAQRDGLSIQVEEADEAISSARPWETSSARERKLEHQLTTLTAASDRAVAAAEKVTAVMAETLKYLESKVRDDVPITAADTVGMLHMMMIAITTMLQMVGSPQPRANSPATAGHGSSPPPE